MGKVMTNVWDLFIKEYSRQSSLPCYIIEYIAVLPIVRMSVEGYSNTRIASRLVLPLEYVEQVLLDFLCFTGWESDIDFSPLAIYNRCGKMYVEYVRDVTQTAVLEMSDDVLSMSFNLCTVYTEIKKELEKYGY